MTSWHPTAHVIADTIDGEVVAIHLVSGRYYSMRGSAAEIWAAVAETTTVDDVASRLAGQHGAEVTAVAPHVERFLARLAADELVEAVDGSSGPTPVAEPTGASGSFEPPVLESFTDLEEMMLLDPVHDVDERGWPHAAPGR